MVPSRDGVEATLLLMVGMGSSLALRMSRRRLCSDDAASALAPYPSALLLGTVDGRVLHVVVGHDAGTERCYVVTVYEPDPEKWERDFRRRKP
jgi:hypothetical protein